MDNDPYMVSGTLVEEHGGWRLYRDAVTLDSKKAGWVIRNPRGGGVTYYQQGQRAMALWDRVKKGEF